MCRRLVRLFAWAYVEYFWTTSDQGVDLGPILHLVAVALGFDLALDPVAVLGALHANKELTGGLLLRRFEQNVKGGLEEIARTEVRVKELIGTWDNSLRELGERTEAG